NAPAQLSALQANLAQIRAMPQSQLDELGRAHRALKRWNDDFSTLWERLSLVGPRLESFRYCREHSPGMLAGLAASLQGRDAGWGFGHRAKLLEAAGDTFVRATRAAAADPANWLLVYDLLVDTRDCLQCADDPGFRPPGRVRSWDASEMDSPAFTL